MSDILKKILATKYREVEAARSRVPLAELERRLQTAPPLRDFAGAIRDKLQAGKAAVIAEIKKASPSAGLFRARIGNDFDPISFAQSYAANGAACLSVLTDADYFQGSVADLVAARAACDLPVLRKDFIVDPYQIVEARAMGADAVLFIMGAVDIALFREWEELAESLGLAVLAESHDESELQQALSLRTRLIGINNRDLTRFVTDINTTLRLKGIVPPDRIVVTESGVEDAIVVAELEKSGVRTFLVGGALMREPDPGEALAKLFSTRLL